MDEALLRFLHVKSGINRLFYRLGTKSGPSSRISSTENRMSNR